MPPHLSPWGERRAVVTDGTLNLLPDFLALLLNIHCFSFPTARAHAVDKVAWLCYYLTTDARIDRSLYQGTNVLARQGESCSSDKLWYGYLGGNRDPWRVADGHNRGRRWSQRTSAAKIEISATVATDILRKGHIPGDRILQRIADGFGVSMAFLDQLAGYSRREDTGIRGQATRLARLLENVPLYRELYQELESATQGQLEQALHFLRLLKSS